MMECWQSKIKNEQKVLHNNFIPVSNYDNYLIRRISYKEANEFILQYEWLGNIGSSKYHFGLFFNNILSCVVCYSSPVSPSSYLKILGFKNNEVLQLSRGASTYWAPKWSASKLISYSNNFLRKSYNAKAIVAYADPVAGEFGTIYQASNFIYLGLTNPGGAKMYEINGNIYHPRKVHKLFGTRKKENIIKIDPKFKTFEIHPKHRYLYLLLNNSKRNECIKKLSHLIKSPPKRMQNIISKAI